MGSAEIDGELEEKRREMRERTQGEPLTNAERKAVVERFQRPKTKMQINLGAFKSPVLETFVLGVGSFIMYLLKLPSYSFCISIKMDCVMLSVVLALGLCLVIVNIVSLSWRKL